MKKLVRLPYPSPPSGKLAPAPPTVVFLEAWINPISVRFVNEFAKQQRDVTVYYLTDNDSLGDAAMDTLSPQVKLIGLRNSKRTRRMVYAPLWLGSFVSKRLRAAYADTLYLHTFPELTATLQRIKPSLIQSNLLVMPYTLEAARYARRAHVPFILRTEERAPHTPFQRLAMNALLIWQKSVVKHASLILPWSPQSEAFVRAQLRVPSERIALLPAGVDTTLFSPGDRWNLQRKKNGKKKLTTPKSAPVRLLTVQRFVPYKDYPTLLNGFRAALDRGLHATLSILGSGPEEFAIRKLIAELHLASHIEMLPARTYKEMPALYRAHDVLVHTGKHEAIGMVVPEAMACGMTAIVCDTAGATTYITPSTGIVYQTGNIQALADALHRMSPKSATVLGQNAAKHIAKQYAVPVTVARYCKLLTSRAVARL